MPRTLRIQYAGAVYHVMDRGNDGQDIFLSDKDRILFLKTLEEACTQTGWIVHAYVLMSNHYHILLETPESNLVDGMGWFQQTYTQRFNRRNGRSGHLYQGRYKSPLVQSDSASDYLLTVSTYIHLNPFRAKMVGWPDKPPIGRYRWSSYSYFAGARKPPGWLSLRKVYAHCGWSARNRKAGSMYRALLRARMAHERDPTNQQEIDEAYRQIRRGWYVGDQQFRDRLTSLLPVDCDRDTLRGEQRRDHGTVGAERLIERALDQLGISETELENMKSTRPEKQAVAWLVKSHTTVTGVWITERLKMGHRVNASRAIARFRDGEGREVRRLKTVMLQCTA